MSADRDRLKGTFDAAAALYQRARPEYPDELYDEVENLAQLQPDAELLEVGCATGKATLPLAKRGYRITCVELGSDLVTAARQNLVGYRNVSIFHGSFESWRPPTSAPFDLVFAATAWNWIDPTVRYGRAYHLLRSGGHLAFWDATHVFPETGDPFFRDIQVIYEEIGEGLLPDTVWARPGEVAEKRMEIEASGLFDDVVVRHFDWEVVYDADEYIDLLSTFSGHIAMAGWQRDRLYGEIRRRLRSRPERTVRRHWEAVLHVATRCG